MVMKMNTATSAVRVVTIGLLIAVLIGAYVATFRSVLPLGDTTSLPSGPDLRFLCNHYREMDAIYEYEGEEVGRIGHFGYLAVVYKIINDGDSRWDYWVIKIVFQAYPDKFKNYDADEYEPYEGEGRIAHIWMKVVIPAGLPGEPNLISYTPRASAGSSSETSSISVSFNLGLTGVPKNVAGVLGGTIGYSVSWSVSIPDVLISDYSRIDGAYGDFAYWEVDVREKASIRKSDVEYEIGKNSLYGEFVVLIRATEGGSGKVEIRARMCFYVRYEYWYFDPYGWGEQLWATAEDWYTTMWLEDCIWLS